MLLRIATLGGALALTAVAAAAEPPPRAAAESRAQSEPRVQHIVDEDDYVRIEELRVRGETRRIVVRPKTAGVKEYEIVPGSGAIDPSQGHRRAARERVWRVFSF